MRKIMYLAIDVDDKAFHGCGITEGLRASEERFRFKSKPSTSALLEKLKDLENRGFELKVCYEASYIGFSLYRDLKAKNFECSVIAPSSVPRAAGDTTKTDRVDAEKLAEYFKKELLTVVHVPDSELEQIRILCRSRIFLAKQIRDLKRHVVGTCRRLGLNYKANAGLKSPAYFTQKHLEWLKTELKKTKQEYAIFSLEMLLSQIKQFEQQVKSIDEKIEVVSQKPEYQKKVRALKCYRGLDVLSSMVLITEIGDINRFAHPSKLTSYVGFDLREYSSGGRERKFSISKMGNHRLRWTIVEACQRVHKIPSISTRLKYRRQDVEPEFIEIADRCMKRLYKKSQRMLLAGKPVNKIKVACGREMLGFVWESLRKAG